MNDTTIRDTFIFGIGMGITTGITIGIIIGAFAMEIIGDDKTPMITYTYVYSSPMPETQPETTIQSQPETLR